MAKYIYMPPLAARIIEEFGMVKPGTGIPVIFKLQSTCKTPHRNFRCLHSDGANFV